jgi:SNF2 family DNA or RNA helicase
MSQDEMAAYKELAKEKVLDCAMDDGTDVSIEAQNAAILSMKLSQMASGAIYIEKGNTDYIKIHERKLDMLEYIIENNNNSPVLVAYHFQSDRAEILRRLEELYNNTRDSRWKCQVFDGSPEMIHTWNKGEIPVMLLQPASAGHGINIQEGGHTLVWYSLPWSLEHYIQTNGRLNRQGQKHPVVIHHLITDGTIDRRIIRALQDKNANQQALLDAVDITLNELRQELERTTG